METPIWKLENEMEKIFVEYHENPKLSQWFYTADTNNFYEKLILLINDKNPTEKRLLKIIRKIISHSENILNNFEKLKKV
jgi:hypothetical protein